MKFYMIIFFSCFLQYTFCQTKKPNSKDLTKSEFISTVEIDAIFPGGMEAFSKYVSTNTQFPEMPDNIFGEITMSYTVGTDGFITNIKLIKNNLGKLGEEISIDVIRVLKSCPKWLPASKNGKHVKWTSIIPLKISNI